MARYQAALAGAEALDYKAMAVLVSAQTEAQAATPEGRAVARALEAAPGVRAWLAALPRTASDAVRKGPAARVEAVPSAAPLPAVAERPRETLASLVARRAEFPVCVRRLLRAVLPDSPAPEPWRQRLEEALTAPTRLECAYGLRVLAREVEAVERSADAYLRRLGNLEEAANWSATAARTASDRLDAVLWVASRDPVGDRRVLDQASPSQIAAQADRPECLVSALRGGVVIGRAERRKALEAVAGLVGAALWARRENTAAQAAAQELAAWRATPEAQRGAEQWQRVSALRAALGEQSLPASYGLNEAAAATERSVSRVESQSAPVPAEYRRWVAHGHRAREVERDWDEGPSM